MVNLPDLHAVPHDKLLRVIRDALYEGDEKTVAGTIEVALERGVDPRTIVSDGLAAGVDRAGLWFGMREEGAAVMALKTGMATLCPHLARIDGPTEGTVVLGTVKGDDHDTGTKLVALMLESAGFTVHDIGGNNAVGDYLDAVETYTPDILGVCALRSWTQPYIRVILEVLRQERRREELIVVVGGAPLQSESTEQFGADAVCCDPAGIVAAAKRLMARRR